MQRISLVNKTSNQAKIYLINPTSIDAQELFHFHEVLYVLGCGNMPTAPSTCAEQVRIAGAERYLWKRPKRYRASSVSPSVVHVSRISFAQVCCLSELIYALLLPA